MIHPSNIDQTGKLICDIHLAAIKQFLAKSIARAARDLGIIRNFNKYYFGK